MQCSTPTIDALECFVRDSARKYALLVRQEAPDASEFHIFTQLKCAGFTSEDASRAVRETK